MKKSLIKISATKISCKSVLQKKIKDKTVIHSMESVNLTA